uniref:Sulfate_transp domain-containing protein n=1 Tax=Syphacia muris TaxID=451379 RepID=A0A0N5AP11_9BILA
MVLLQVTSPDTEAYIGNEPALIQEEFERRYLKDNETAEKSVIRKAIRRLTKCSPLSCICSFFPIFCWLPRYKWHTDLHGDIVGGLTVGIMHVPQGMAYATLASLPPVYGLYSSFFASTIYSFFGTSKHISIGTFAVGSLMVGSTRLRLLPDSEAMNNVTALTNGTFEDDNSLIHEGLTPVMITSALTFGLVMAFLHLGFLTAYLSDPLISGFTTGSACHVFMAQINKILGVKLPRYNGIGQLFLMCRDLIKAIPVANIYTVALSLFGILFLKVGKSCINPFIQKRYSIPFPTELLLVIIATVFSSAVNLKKQCGIHIVDYVPQGVPMPTVPRFDILSSMVADSIGIAFVCYTFVISMAKLFAKKRKYSIDPQQKPKKYETATYIQEIYAVSFMSLLSSFFPVYPCGASLSRSSVCEQSGTRTQLHTFFSSSLLLAVIIWIGPLLEPLPMCILACIVVVSLESLFLQVKELPLLWRISPFDFVCVCL